MPMSRVTRVLRNNRDVGKIERGAIFLIAKATESFLERSVWDAARVTSRSNRKTIMLRDLITSMHEQANPESMQVFLGARRHPRRTSPRRLCWEGRDLSAPAHARIFPTSTTKSPARIPKLQSAPPTMASKTMVR